MYLVYLHEMRKFLRRFTTGDAGNIAMLTAVAMPLLVGAAGLGAETALWFHYDLELQQAADKAVYAAAIERRAGSNNKTILSAATTLATENGYTPGTIAVNYPPKAGAYAGKTTAIEVELTREIPRFFTKFFTNTPVIDKARAVASMQNSADACVLALSTSAPRAVYVSGSGNLSLQGCTVMSNSVKNDAIYVGGSGKLKADCLIAVGGITISKSDLVVTTCKTTITNAPPVGDPYADIKSPDVAAAAVKTVPGGAAPLQPGNYTSGMNLSGTKTLNPGVYIVSGGNFSIGANANISGAGVTIYLAPGVSVSMNGTATVKLSAPTSGAYSGMLFFGDRSATGTAKFNGTASSLLTGSLYFPNQDVQYLGNFSGNGGCTRVVGKTVDWSGNATVSQDCASYGMKTIPALQIVKLVE